MKCLPILLLLLAPAVLLTGCDPKPAPVALAPAPSSHEALIRALDAMEHADRQAMLSLVSGGPKAHDFFATLTDSASIIHSFRQKFVNAYGEDAWTAFLAPLPENQKRPDMYIDWPDFSLLKKESADWEANAENQGLFHEFPGIPLSFKQVDGGWVIDGKKVFPDEKTLIRSIGTQRILNNFIKSHLKAIGHPRISAEDIDYQMGKDVMILLGWDFRTNSQPAYPDRFKLDQL